MSSVEQWISRSRYEEGEEAREWEGGREGGKRVSSRTDIGWSRVGRK